MRRKKAFGRERRQSSDARPSTHPEPLEGVRDAAKHEAPHQRHVHDHQATHELVHGHLGGDEAHG
jgi:hypothetical protein